MKRIVESILVGSTGELDRLPEPSLPEVAFAGRSNVGKSSLLNAICGRKGLFKVSSSPGRTRTIIHVEARLDSSERLYMVDLPGYGYARVSRAARAAWAEFMYGYLDGRPTLHLVVVLVDVRRGPQAEEAQLISFLQQRQVPVMLVATKLDRVKKSEQKLLLARLYQQTGVKVMGTSAQKKEGTERLLQVICAQLFPGDG